jgi:protein-disulfide isomerase
MVLNMVECDFCGEEFDTDVDLHVHWGDEHEEELNSHQEDKVDDAREEKERARKESRKRKKDLAFKGLATVFILGVAAVVIPQILGSASGEDDPTSRASTVSTGGEPVLGNDSAPVTVVEYGDFYCPACKSFQASIKPRLVENYIDSGQAKLVYKDFPLQIHEPQATRAAVAAECTFKQDEDAYWNVYDALYENQRALDYSDSGLVDLVNRSTTGLDAGELETCISSSETESEVQADKREGFEDGVDGTPQIYVNGRKAPDFSYSTVSTLIEQELSK